MALLVAVLLPLFCLILAGYVAARRGLIDTQGVAGLNGFVLYFALPLMLFHNVATAPLAERFEVGFIIAYLVAGFVIHLTGMAVARWIFRCRLGVQAVQGIGASFGNTVFIALPIAVAIFGPAAELPMALLIAIEHGILMPFTVVLLEIKRTGTGQLPRALRTALGTMVRNPVVMSVLLGAAVALLGLTLPSLLDGIVLLIQGANVPCALFALGATLAGLPLVRDLREASSMVALKLFVYPTLVLATMLLLVPDLDPMWRAVALLAAAVPVGADVYLLASRYETGLARASTAVLVSTALSVVTISTLAVVLTAD